MAQPLKWIVSQQGGKWILTCTLPVGDWTGWTLDPTLTLQPDAADGIDTWLNGLSTNTDDNNGISSILVAGGSVDPNARLRGLVQFDLSSIPAHAVIGSAVLTLYCESEADTSDRVVGVHRGLVSWFEGVRDGVTPGAGEDGSTYNHRNQNGNVHWGSVGGLAGTDYTATATALQTITSPSAAYNWTVTADAAAWVAGTAVNYGLWVILPDENTQNSRKRLTSSDGTTAAYRPLLTVTYTLPLACRRALTGIGI